MKDTDKVNRKLFDDGGSEKMSLGLSWTHVYFVYFVDTDSRS
jgi:hypothetical protein